MLTSLSINNYRSALDVVIPLKKINVITGPNGSGKSNLYKSLRLLAETANGGVVNSLASEGGLESTFWAGPEKITDAHKRGEVPIEYSRWSDVKRLRLGFTTEDFGYSISLGLPPPDMDPDNPTAFSLDPEIKRECIWAGNVFRPAGLLIDRKGPAISIRTSNGWDTVVHNIETFSSMFDRVSDPNLAPEVFLMRETIRSWRFYDHFRTDRGAPARKPQLGTRTPVLHNDGRDLAAAIQTIIEIGDLKALEETISDAFPGAKLEVVQHSHGRFSLSFQQHGLLRPLSGAELSDGTLRYILWVAALLTPRPPKLMVLNEPETSLHPDLLPALARLILKASEKTQIWVVSHAKPLIDILKKHEECKTIELSKELGQTEIIGQSNLEKMGWRWPDK